MSVAVNRQTAANNNGKTPAPQAAAVTPTAASMSKDGFQRTAPANTAVPGENIRTGLWIAGQVLGPVATAEQAIKQLAPLVAGKVVLGTAARGALKFMEAIEHFPGGAVALKGIARIVPWLGAGVLAFDGYAAIKTFTDPAASTKRKLLTGARFALNAVSTAISFVPGWGMLAAIAPGMAAMCFDFAIKGMNGRHEA